MIYKPSRVTLVGDSIADTDSVNNRPPFAQAFQFKAGSIFSVIVNHMKSKGSCPSSSTDPNGDKGDGQGCFSALRSAQAQRLIDFLIPEMQKSSRSNNVMIIGDLNAYGREDPIAVLTSNGLLDQIDRLVRPTGIPYSYIFDGESGYIDHALTTSSMSPLIAGVTEWHINGTF
jgi:predicted extracellular nuclease